MKRSLTALAIGVALSAPAAPAAVQTAPPARYAAAIEAELRQMGIAAACASESATRHRCRASRPAAGADAWLHLVYSDESDTIYFYFERYLLVPSDHARAATVLRRLMELNWDLLIGKFEWNPRTGEVRLGATLNTDSNFDRRAFRSIIAALDTLAARYAAELRDLAGP